MKPLRLRPLGSPRALALTILFLAALPLGCGDDDPADVCAPEVPAGRIQGTVQTGGVAIEATVRTTRIHGDGVTQTVVVTPVSPTGAYSVDVPAGRYVVSLYFQVTGEQYYYSRAGLRYGDAPPDTIDVDGSSSPVQIDFPLASIHLRLDFPPGLGEIYPRVLLYRRGAPPPDNVLTSRDSFYVPLEDDHIDAILDGVIPGSYRVRVEFRSQGYAYHVSQGEHLWMPGTRDTTSAPYIEVPVDQLVELNGRYDAEPARIEGEVVGAWLDFALYDRPSITLVRPDSALILGPNFVEKDGTFRIDLLVPEPAKILVDQQGIGQWVGGRTFEEATLFDLEPGEILTGVRVVQSGVRLSGSGPGGGWHYVRFYDSHDRREIGTCAEFDLSEMSGIANLRPGSYLMRIEPGSPGASIAAPQWYDRATTAEEAQPITIANEGEIVTVPVVLEAGGSIHGSFVDDGSGPGGSESYFVFVTPANRTSYWCRVAPSTGSEEIEIRGLPDGDWKVGVWRRDGTWTEQPPAGTVWYPGTTDWEAAEAIEIRDFGHVEGIEIVLR